MELISQRVASGLSIKPPKKPKKSKDRNAELISIQSQTERKPVDWKKWGERAALGKAWANNGKRLFTGDEVRARLFNIFF
jgi:GRAM domain-containing protein 4